MENSTDSQIKIDSSNNILMILEKKKNIVDGKDVTLYRNNENGKLYNEKAVLCGIQLKNGSWKLYKSYYK